MSLAAAATRPGRRCGSVTQRTDATGCAPHPGRREGSPADDGDEVDVCHHIEPLLRHALEKVEELQHERHELLFLRKDDAPPPTYSWPRSSSFFFLFRIGVGRHDVD